MKWLVPHVNSHEQIILYTDMMRVVRFGGIVSYKSIFGRVNHAFDVGCCNDVLGRYAGNGGQMGSQLGDITGSNVT
jgi:hypothetical protein